MIFGKKKPNAGTCIGRMILLTLLFSLSPDLIRRREAPRLRHDVRFRERRISPGDSKVRVAEHLLERIKIAAEAEELDRERVADRMRADVLSRDPCGFGEAAYDLVEAVPRQWAAFFAAAFGDKDGAIVLARSVSKVFPKGA